MAEQGESATANGDSKPKKDRWIPQWGNVSSYYSKKQKFGGNFTQRITDDELEFLRLRDFAARKIVVGPALEAFKRPPEIRAVGDEKNTLGIAAMELIRRIAYFDSLRKAYEGARHLGFGLVAFGLATVEDMDKPIGTVRGIDNTTFISKRQVKKYRFNNDPMQPDYGAIKDYQVEFSIDGQRVTRWINAQRVQHVLNDVYNENPEGVSVLMPLYNMFQGKLNMDLSLFHAIHRYAQPFTTLELPEDAEEDEFDDMSSTFYLDERNEFVMPYGYKIEQYGAQHALNPDPYIKYVWESMAAGSEYNTTVLKGTEAGAITGSWVNQATFYNAIADIQKMYLEPHIVDFILNCQNWGLLPQGDFEVYWPKLWELDQKEMAQTRQAHAVAALTEARAVQVYAQLLQGGVAQDGSPIQPAIEGVELAFDERGFYLKESGDTGTRIDLFPTGDSDKRVQATSNTYRGRRYVSQEYSGSVALLNRSKAERDRLWKQWGYKTTNLELKHYSAQLTGYSDIITDLWNQIEKIMQENDYATNNGNRDGQWQKGHKAAAIAYSQDKADQLPDDLRKHYDSLTEVIDAIATETNIPKKLALDMVFNDMMADSHQYGWAVTVAAMDNIGLGYGDPEYQITETRATVFLQRSKLLWEQKAGDCLNAARNRIVEGLLAGESYQQIHDRLVDSINKVARPEVFVNTEVHRAVESGRIDLYKSVGMTKGEYLTAGDERVRPEHEARDGQIYPLDEAEALLSEPNCRCTIIPVQQGGTS